MTYVSYLSIRYLLITSFFYLFSAPLSARDVHRVPVLERAEQSIENGRPKEALSYLSNAKGLSQAASSWREVLRARIQHEGGDCIGAMQLLRGVIQGLRRDEANAEVLAEAYLEYARICRTMSWVEPYKHYNDTVGMLMGRHHFPDHLRFRYFTHRLQYLSLMMLIPKAFESLDSLNSLLDKAPVLLKYRYQPDYALAVRISYERNRDRSKAKKIADSILIRIDDDGGTHPNYSRVLVWRSIANYYMDDVNGRLSPSAYSDEKYARADRSFNKALSLLNQVYPGNIIDRVMIVDLKGLLNFKHGKPDLAKSYFISAESLLKNSSISANDYYYIYYVTSFYKMHITDLVYRGNELKKELKRSLDQFIEIAAAWPKWELINSDSLDHYYFTYTLSPFNIITQICYQLQSEDRSKYLDLAFQAQERAKHQRMRQRMLIQSGISDPGYASLSHVQKEMAADEVILSVSDMNGTLERSYFMVIKKDTAFLMEMLDFRRFIHSYGLREPEETAFRDLYKFKKAYHQLWKLVFEPLLPFMKGIRTIRLLPSGFTSGYYFGLMIPDTTGVRKFGDIRYLRDDYRIRYDYSWTIADIRRRIPREVKVDQQNVAFMPNYQSTSYYQLKFFDAMAGSLNRDFKFRVYENKTATVDRCLKELPSARILHLGAHGYSHNYFQYDQFIVMDSLPDKGAYLLTPHHLNQIQTNADLAVLSICMGGFSVWNHLDTRNLAYWFNYAGARSCLYAHWKIDDRSTAKILNRFYVHLSDGMDRYEALHAAQNDYLKEARTDEERNPIYWGGLTMIGEDGPVPLERRNYGWLWIFLFSGIWVLIFLKVDH